MKMAFVPPLLQLVLGVYCQMPSNERRNVGTPSYILRFPSIPCFHQHIRTQAASTMSNIVHRNNCIPWSSPVIWLRSDKQHDKLPQFNLTLLQWYNTFNLSSKRNNQVSRYAPLLIDNLKYTLPTSHITNLVKLQAWDPSFADNVIHLLHHLISTQRWHV